MLRRLELRSLAIVDGIDLEFSPGLTVITGETGAGKSILLDGLDLALGARASRHVVRQGAAAALVTARFAGTGAGDVVLSREIAENGRSVSRIDGRTASGAELREVSAGLVELLAQGEAATLLRPERQRELLDRFGGTQELYRELLGLVARRGEISRELLGGGGDERQRARQVELLRHQVEEIGRAAPRGGELAEIDREIDLLSRQEDILQALSEARAWLREDERGAEDTTGRAAARLRPFARLHREIERIEAVLVEAQGLLAEAVSSIAGLADGLEFDPQALRRAEARRTELMDLRRKYGADEEEILRFSQAAREELSRLEEWEGRAGELAEQLAALDRAIAEGTAELARRRRVGAQALEQAVEPELARLSLAEAALRVVVEEGIAEDAVRFDFAPNPGELPKPLTAIASGGEVSRVLLALGSILARDERSTLVCDEIDQGLGGVAARHLADHLAAVSRHRQVIAVSHQAVVAARAERHIGLTKEVVDGRTVVRAEVLQGEARVREVARMLSGESGELALRHAAELLAQGGPDGGG